MTRTHSTPKKKRKPAAKRGVAADSRHWIVVADHRQAHVYRKTPEGIRRVPAECLPCALPAPGGEPDDQSFLQDLADWLQAAAQEEAFDRLAIIAAPAALKSMHPLLDKKVRACICAALEKDIARITEDEIEDHLAEVVWL